MTPPHADDLARAEIAKQIKVHIAGSTDIHQLVVSEDGDEVQKLRFEELTRSASDLTVEGIKIAERYVGEKQVCSLAILNKAENLEKLAKRLRHLSEEIQKLAALVDLGVDPVDEAKLLKDQIPYLRERNAAYSVYVGIGGTVFKPGPHSLAETIARYRQILGEMRVAIRTDGGVPSERLSAVLEEQLTACGIPLVKDGDAPLTAFIELKMSPSARQSKQYVFRVGTFTGRLFRGDLKNVKVTSTFSEEMGHRNLSALQEKIILTMSDAPLQKFSARVCNWWMEHLAEIE